MSKPLDTSQSRELSDKISQSISHIRAFQERGDKEMEEKEIMFLFDKAEELMILAGSAISVDKTVSNF